MNIPDQINLAGIATALGIGLLIGVERERRQTEGPDRSPAGIRTFTLAAFLGALSISTGGIPALVMAGAVLGLLAAAGYFRSRDKDPGLTTEVALVITFLLGALAINESAVAAGLGVLVAIILASRQHLHRIVKQVITGDEVRDGLLFAAAALIVLPLTPDHTIGPYGVLNLRTLWTLAVIIMAINSLGHISMRMFGPRLGLAFTGLASGFISSSATIAFMGSYVSHSKTLERSAVAGAVLSSVATVINLAIVIGAISLNTLMVVAIPLACSGTAAVLYAGFFTWKSFDPVEKVDIPTGRAFNPLTAITFVLTISLVLLVSAFLADWLGNSGITLAAAVAGLADTHAAAAAVASMVAEKGFPVSSAAIPILLGFTTNSLTKCVVALSTGQRSYYLRVMPGVLLMTALAWLGLFLQSAVAPAILVPR